MTSDFPASHRFTAQPAARFFHGNSAAAGKDFTSLQMMTLMLVQSRCIYCSERCRQIRLKYVSKFSMCISGQFYFLEDIFLVLLFGRVSSVFSEFLSNVSAEKRRKRRQIRFHINPDFEERLTTGCFASVRSRSGHLSKS